MAGMGVISSLLVSHVPSEFPLEVLLTLLHPPQVHRCHSGFCGERMGSWYWQVWPGGGTGRDSALGRAVSCSVRSGLPEEGLP